MNLNDLHWGLAGDKPAPGDYDGDGRVNLKVPCKQTLTRHFRVAKQIGY